MNSIKSRERSFIDQIRQIIVHAFDMRHIIKEQIRYCVVTINVIFVLFQLFTHHICDGNYRKVVELNKNGG